MNRTELEASIAKMEKELIVLMLDGWQLSTGVTAEIEIANALGLPVHFMEPVSA